MLKAEQIKKEKKNRLFKANTLKEKTTNLRENTNPSAGRGRS